MKWLWPVSTLLSLGAAIYFYAEYRSLRESASDVPAHSAASPLKVAAEEDAPSPEPSSSRTRRLLTRLGNVASRDRPELPEPATETRQERRQRRSLEMREMFGRQPGESEEDYLARVRPMVVAGLAAPRVRLASARDAALQRAEVTDEQQQAIDAVLDDAMAESLDLVNTAVEDGELSPYRRNWVGALSVAGGFGAVLTGVETRIGEVLSPEQQRVLYDEGFEWGEYLGVTTPWEQLRPPPPASE